MRILLQHARTGLYLRALGNWTSDFREAFDFGHSRKAIDFACLHCIAGVQIAVRFDDSEVDDVVSLPQLERIMPNQVRMR
jgi:hypothetical protein